MLTRMLPKSMHVSLEIALTVVCIMMSHQPRQVTTLPTSTSTLVPSWLLEMPHAVKLADAPYFVTGVLYTRATQLYHHAFNSRPAHEHKFMNANLN